MGRRLLRLSNTRRNFPHFKPLVCFEVPLAPEPVLHGGLKPFEGHAQTGFEHAIGNGQRIVKDRVVGEIA
jgi:hypothetical protein